MALIPLCNTMQLLTLLDRHQISGWLSWEEWGRARLQGQEKIEKGKNTTKTKGLKVTLEMLQV